MDAFRSDTSDPWGGLYGGGRAAPSYGLISSLDSSKSLKVRTCPVFFRVKSGGLRMGVADGENELVVCTYIDTEGWSFGGSFAHDCRPTGWTELCCY